MAPNLLSCTSEPTACLTAAPTAALANAFSTSLPLNWVPAIASTMPLTARFAANSSRNSWVNSSAAFCRASFQYGSYSASVCVPRRNSPPHSMRFASRMRRFQPRSSVTPPR
ncbi:hypothetical protein [Dactylosporangium cerinum]